MKSTLRFIKQGSSKIKLAQAILSLCVLSLVATTNLFAQSTYTFNTVSGSGTKTLTTTVDGITLTAYQGVQGSGNNVNVSSGFLEFGQSSNDDTWTITFSAPVNITQFDIGEFINNSGNGDYVFTPDNGSIVRIADNSALIVGAIATLNPTDWTSVTSVVMSFTNPGTNFHRLGIDNIDFTAAPSNSAPTVTTSAASSITATGATLSGNVTDDGGDTVTDRGFVYSTSSGPTTSDTKVQDGSGTGSFSEAVTGLNSQTTYYVRAYAINSEGTSYGSQQSFTTSAAPSGQATLEFTGGYTSIASFGASPRSGNLTMSEDGINYTFESVGGGSGVIVRNTTGDGDAITFTMNPPHSYYSFKRTDGSNFQLDNLNIEFNIGNVTSATLAGYNNGSAVSGAIESITFTQSAIQNVDVSGNTNFDSIDEFRITFSGSPDNNATTVLSDVTYSAAAAPALDPIQSLYWPNENNDKIEGISLIGSSRQDIVSIASSGSIIAIDIDHANEKAYWFDQTDSKIYRSNLDGTGIEEFVSDPGYATTIFVDHVNEYLYWPNSGSSKIERIKLDGTGREDVISATDPIGISVDVSGSKVYWYDQTNGSIYRGDLDGSGSEEFISDPGYATTVYIDQKNNYLYWPNYDDSKIERIKLDGTGREDVISATDPIGISVDVSGSKVYWYDSSNENIRRANLDGTGSEVFISNSGYATTLSIPWEMPDNNAPTDITLNSTDVNQSAGSNTVVGSLSTTDTDGSDTHSYTLVSGTGDTDNGSFNINGSNLRATDASALAAGEYSVRIQTDDGTDTFAKAFTITVNDDVAPGFTNSTPSVSGTTGSQTTLTVQLDETGTAYYVVVADGDVAPSSAQVKAGQNSGGAGALFSGSLTVSSASQDFTEDITGLSQNTAYDVYVVAEDGQGNLQSSPETLNVETVGPPAFTSTPNTEVDYGQLYSYSMTATEVGDLATTISAPTLPQWLTLSTGGQSEAGQSGNIPDGTAIIGVSGDDKGNIYAANSNGSTIYKIEPDGTTTEWASGLIVGNVYALHVAGNYLYIPRHTDGNNSITRVSLDNPSAGEEVFAAFPGGAVSLTDREDWIYAANYTATEIKRIHKTDQTIETVLTSSDGLTRPFGLEFDDNDNLYIALLNSGSIAKYDGSNVTTILSDLPKSPTSVKLDADGNFYISMNNGGIRKYDADWNDYSYVSRGETDDIYSISFTNTGTLVYGINGTNEVYRLQTGAVLSGTPAKSDVGNHSVVLEATNDAGSNQQSFNIEVQDNAAPVVHTYSPADQTIDIDHQPTLSLTFDEEIVLGTEGTLSLYDGATELQSYDLSVPAERDNFSLSVDNKTFSLDVDADLPLNTEISVEISNGGTDNFAEDVHGNAFAGFTAGSNTWTFTTIANTAPVAGNVSFSGSLKAGDELTASYNYSDADNDTESGTTYQWYRSDDDQEAGKAAINGATSSSYTTVGDDVGKYISFEVTPNDGIEFGSAVESTLQGPVFTEPELVTSAATGVEALEATLNAEVTTDNFDSVTDRGFVYSLTATPTLAADSVLAAGDGVGTYSALAQNLLPNRTYYVRSYATNSAGTVYGNEVNVTTGKKELTLAGSFTALDKEYDGTTSVTTSENTLEVTGLEGTDQANLASVDLHFAQADTGTAITVTVTNPVVEGPDAENYTVTADGAPTSSASILPKELTIGGAFSIAEKRYDGTTGAVINDNNLTLDGVVAAETVTLDDVELNFPQSDAGTGLVVSLSSPVIGGADASNYTITTDGAPTLTADLLPFVLTLSDFTADDKVYDGTVDVTGTGFSDNRLDGDQIEFSYDAEFENIQAGTGINVNYTNIAVSGGTDQNNYTLASSTGSTTADIAQRPVSIAANAASKVYGEGDPQFTYELTSGSLVGPDSFSGTLDRTGDESVGVYTITQGSLGAGGNYSITFTSADFEITQKALTIVANSDQTKVYGENDPALTFAVSGFEFTDDEQLLNGSLDRMSGEDVGTYAIGTGNVDAGPNYSISFTPADFEITPRQLTLSNFSAQSKVYDGTANVVGTSFADDRLNGDELEFAYTAALQDINAGNQRDVSYSSITISGGEDAGNYALVTADGVTSTQILPRPVTIAAQPVEIVYGEPDPALTYEITSGSLVDGDSFSGNLSRTGDQNVGSYSIVQNTLTAGSNYDITYQSADFEITQRTLAITADADQTKIYGEADPVFTFEATNFGWNDGESLLTGALARETDEDVGQYAIGQGNLDAGDNYTIDFNPAGFEITQKALTIVANSDQSKVYGESDPVLTYTVTGFELTDDEKVLTGSLSRAVGEDAGTYEIGAGDIDAGSNYSINFTSADFEIEQRPLVLSNFVADGKTYDGTDNVTGDGFDDDRLSGDDLSFTYAAAFSDADAGTDKDVNFSGIQVNGGSDQDNYDLKTTVGTATATIARRELTVAANAVAITYGEPDPALVYDITAGSLVAGDTFAGDLSRTGNQNVGSYTIEQNTLTAGSNYEITYHAADFEINPRELNVTADADQTKTYGETDPEFTFETTNFGWSDDESILIGELIRTAGEDVGLYEIGQGNLNAGNNYTISYTESDFEITAKELTVVADANQQKTYGDDDPNTFTFAASNFADGEDTSILSGSLTRDAGEDAGTYAITAGDLTAGANYQISFTSADFEILPAVLTIAAVENQTKTYGDDDPDFDWTAVGFKFSDDEQIVGGKMDRVAGENTGSYELSAGTLDAGGNYTINYTPADFAITPASLLVIAGDEQWKFEGSVDPEFTYTAAGFKFDDDESLFEGALVRDTGETPGDYAIGAGNLSAGDNYEINFTGADFSILRTPPVVIAQSPVEEEERVDLDAIITAEFDHEISIADAALMSLTGPDATTIPLSATADGTVLTLTHGGLSHHTNYTLVIGEGALDNVDGIGNEAETWSFTTIMSAPIAENPSPVDGATHVGVNEPLSVGFSQDVTLADASGISIVSVGDDSQENIQAELSDNVLTISHGGLDNLTEYTISIPRGTVQNADGVGNEPASWSFTSIVPVPEPVVLGTPINREGAVSLDAEFEWEPTAHADYYRIQVSETETFDSPLEDVDQLTDLTFTPAEPLGDYQTYFWRVKASNDGGESDWSDVHRFTTIANTPGAVFPLMNAQNISIAPMPEWQSGYQTTYRVQLADSDDFETLVADSLTTNRAVQLTGLEEDAEYFWRVKVKTDSTESSWTDAIKFRTRPAASTEDDEQVVDHSVTFGETSNPEERVISELDYRMVGLPGNDHHGVEDFFQGKYGREWKVFYENGNVTEYYDEYEPGDDRFLFAPGRGFWVLSTDIVDFDLKITSVETNERDAYSVTLHPGWNIITNPHRGPVSWSDVQEMNDFSGDAWGYDQRFVLADTLHPVQGYYVYNHPDQPREYLDIPYATMEQRRSEERGKALLAAKSTTSLPAVNLSAEFGENGRFDTEILYPDLANTKVASDEFDEESLRRYYPSLEMSRSGMMLVNEEHVARGGLLREVSRFDADGTELELHIKGETGEPFSWNLDLQQMPEQTRVLIVNRANSKTWLLKHGEEMETTLTEPNAVYDLYTGDRDRLEQLQKDLMPQEFSLEPNYPNPFNPMTNIRYSIPAQQHVKLEVYDVIGRRVKVLTNNVQQAGWHVVQFDAGSLASGVYLYRLTTDNNVKVRKMTLVK